MFGKLQEVTIVIQFGTLGLACKVYGQNFKFSVWETMTRKNTIETNPLPDMTPEVQAQMESMIKDPNVMKSVASMMKNMDPEMMRQLGMDQPVYDDKIDTLKMPSASKASRPPVEMITPRYFRLRIKIMTLSCVFSDA